MQPIAFKTYNYLLPLSGPGTANTKINFESIQALEGADIYGLQLITNTGGVSPSNETAIGVTFAINCSITLVRGDIEIIKNHPLSDFNNDTFNYIPNGQYYQLPIRMFTPQKFDLTKSFVTIHTNLGPISNSVAMINFIYR
jgi:hypothetical protein